MPSFSRGITSPPRTGKEAEHCTNRGCKRREGIFGAPAESRCGLARPLSRFRRRFNPLAAIPRFVLRSEPAAVRFQGKSQAIGGRRLVMGGRVLRRPRGPLVRNPPMLALAATAP